MLFTLLYLFLALYRRQLFEDFKVVTFIVSLITFFVVIAIESADVFNSGLYLIPFAGVPIIITVFTDARTAIFSHVICILMIALAAPFQFQFVVIQFVVGISATFCIHRLSRRSQLLRTALVTFALYNVCYAMMLTLSEGTVTAFSWRMVGVFAINIYCYSEGEDECRCRKGTECKFAAKYPY